MQCSRFLLLCSDPHECCRERKPWLSSTRSAEPSEPRGSPFVWMGPRGSRGGCRVCPGTAGHLCSPRSAGADLVVLPSVLWCHLQSRPGVFQSAGWGPTGSLAPASGFRPGRGMSRGGASPGQSCGRAVPSALLTLSGICLHMGVLRKISLEKSPAAGEAHSRPTALDHEGRAVGVGGWLIVELAWLSRRWFGTCVTSLMRTLL